MEHITLLIIICSWLFVVAVCLDKMLNIIITAYYDYINNKKLKRFKKSLKKCPRSKIINK